MRNSIPSSAPEGREVVVGAIEAFAYITGQLGAVEDDNTMPRGSQVPELMDVSSDM
jgi:hypothetical protein